MKPRTLKRTIRVLALLLGVCLLLLMAPACYDAWARGVVETRMAECEREEGTRYMKGGAPVRIDRGRDRACLLLHGFMSAPADFGPLPEALDAAGWDVHAPVLPGHGTDPRDLCGLSADDMAAAPRREYLALRKRYETVVLVGFSLGGAISIRLADEKPPDALVLINPYLASTYKAYYVLPPRWWHAMLTPLLDWVVRPAGIFNVNRPEGEAEIVAYRAIPTEAFAAVFEAACRASETELRGCRVLVILSDGDSTASPKAARRWAEMRLAGETPIRSFARSDHLLLLDYDREEATRAVVEFIESIPTDATGE